MSTLIADIRKQQRKTQSRLNKLKKQMKTKQHQYFDYLALSREIVKAQVELDVLAQLVEVSHE